jgi:hypothetical protein
LTEIETELSRPELTSRLVMMSAVQFLTAIGYYGFSHWVPALLRAKGADLSHTLGYTATEKSGTRGRFIAPDLVGTIALVSSDSARDVLL